MLPAWRTACRRAAHTRATDSTKTSGLFTYETYARRTDRTQPETRLEFALRAHPPCPPRCAHASSGHGIHARPCTDAHPRRWRVYSNIHNCIYRLLQQTLHASASAGRGRAPPAPPLYSSSMPSSSSSMILIFFTACAASLLTAPFGTWIRMSDFLPVSAFTSPPLRSTL